MTSKYPCHLQASVIQELKQVNYQSEGVLSPGSNILHVDRDAEPYKCVTVRLKVLVWMDEWDSW